MNNVRHQFLNLGSAILLLPFLASPGRALPSGTSAEVSSSTPATLTIPITHVFLILMENHGYDQVWNTASSPYTTALGKVYSRAANYYATGHPSLPNYLDLYAGSNYTITNDCSPSSSCHINARNLADNLEAKGLTWKFYEESMAAPCALASSGNYAAKHNPVVYFDDVRLNSTRCKDHVVPFSTFATNLALLSTTPNYSFITPNLCSDTHDCPVSTGDTWLKYHVPAILKSPACVSAKCLVVITWDEDNGHSGNHVLTIFAGSGAKTGGVAATTKFNHYSLLRTVEYIFGLACQTTRDSAVAPMTELLR